MLTSQNTIQKPGFGLSKMVQTSMKRLPTVPSVSALLKGGVRN